MAAKLYNTIKKLEESIEAEKTNQATAKAALNRLATERQTHHQAVVNDKHKTSDEIEQAKTELKRIEDERKAADKQFRDSTTTLTDLYKEKDQAGDELTTVLETPVVNTTNEALVIELNELKSAFALMTLDQEKKPKTQAQKTDQGVLQELVQLMKADKKGGEPVTVTPPTTTPRTKSLATMPILTKAAA